MENPLHRHACEVAFGDTDASGWMHFPNAFHYVEAAEHSFLRSRGIVVFDRSTGGWPRVNVSCDYKRPLRCGDKIEVHLAITRLGAASITWAFELLDPTGQTAATGSMTTVRVDHQGKPMEIPESERSALAS